MVDRVVWDGTFHGLFEDKAYALEVFRRHNEHVRRVVSAERLLVYEVKEGWGPLCAFLGVPVPEGKPFPRLNDAQEFRARIARMAGRVRMIGYSTLAVSALLLAWLVGLILW
jgi:hypothetical protein